MLRVNFLSINEIDASLVPVPLSRFFLGFTYMLLLVFVPFLTKRRTFFAQDLC